ncbi:MAG: extracellular solute-binding protein [Firmicutes bacterium]|nr:extracellular solute-binding protein [Bacillota bacterium]
MKKSLALFLAVLMVFALVACGNGGTATTAPATTAPATTAPATTTTTAPATTAPAATTDPASMTGDLRVTYQAWMASKYDFDKMKADFEANHPGVNVVYAQVDTADVTTNMLQWSQGKTDCDIAIGGSREMAVQYAAKGYIIPFDDSFFTGDLAKDKFFAPFLELGNIEGTQYMVPFTGEVMFIVCNTQLMKNAGLVNADGTITAPKTWDDLYNYAKAATVKNGDKLVTTGLSIDWGANFMTYSYLSSLQGIKGNIFEADGHTIDFTSDSVTYLLNMWRQLVADGFTPTDTFADNDAGRTNFKAGNVAMLMTAASRWIESQTNLGGPGTTSLIPIPGTDTNGSLVYIHGAVIPVFSPKIELAKLFIKEELLNSDVQKNAMNKTGKMSPLLANYQGLTDPYWPVVIQATENGITTPLYKDFSKLDTGIQTELQKCISGAQSVADTQKNLSTLIQSLDLTTGLK